MTKKQIFKRVWILLNKGAGNFTEDENEEFLNYFKDRTVNFSEGQIHVSGQDVTKFSTNALRTNRGKYVAKPENGPDEPPEEDENGIPESATITEIGNKLIAEKDFDTSSNLKHPQLIIEFDDDNKITLMSAYYDAT